MVGMSEPMTVRYSPAGVVQAVLEVDGKDLSAVVSRVSIDHAAGSAPSVYLELKKGVPVEDVLLKGMVHVKETVHEDPADACLRFLEPIDPGELERSAMAALELGGPTTFGEAVLAVLRGWARGDV